MRHISNPARILVALVLVNAACDAGETKPKPEATAKTEDASKPEEAPKPEAPAVFHGDKVTLPPQFAGLEFGMTLAEAKAVVPSMDDKGQFTVDTVPNMKFAAMFPTDDDAPVITKFSVSPDTDMVAQLTELWGPLSERSHHRRKWRGWFNPEAGLRALIDGSSKTIEFTRYQPIAKYLGEGPELGFQAKAPMLGMTSTEFNAAYEEWLSPKLRELIREKGAAEVRPSVLVLPPLEWETEPQRLTILWSDGKIDKVMLRLAYGDDPAAKAEIMALLVAKWGAATEVEPSKVWVFSEAAIPIQLGDLTDELHWRLAVGGTPRK